MNDGLNITFFSRSFQTSTFVCVCVPCVYCMCMCIFVCIYLYVCVLTANESAGNLLSLAVCGRLVGCGSTALLPCLCYSSLLVLAALRLR